MNPIQEKIQNLFVKHFNGPAKFIARAPGRVNLIGEHTDYNEGFVFPMALDRAVWLAFTPNQTSMMSVIASNFDEELCTIDLKHLAPAEGTWIEYIKGMADQLQRHFECDLFGCDAVIYSDVPIGAGLSSSAALELATARALTQCSKIVWQPVLMAQLAQKAENEWVGVKCGIMDQLISAVGVQDHAVLIDCRTLEYEACPLPKDTSVVILDTSTRRGLIESHYNERREQCQLGAEQLSVPSLRDASLTAVEQLVANNKVYKRAKHVVSECQRTLMAKKAMLANDPVQLGELFKQSHQSLTEDFEVTNEALDNIVAIANQQPGCYGARMTGAGFGGCAVALVNQQQVEQFCENVTLQFAEKSGLTADVHVVKADDGVNLIVIDA